MLKYLFIFLIGIGMISLTTSYTAPTYNSINFTLCSDYTAPTYNSINFTLGESDSCITDTCTYTSGDWEIECSDNCTIETQVLIDGNDLVFNGTGFFYASANITNWGNLNLSTGCNIVLDDGVSLISA